MQKVILNNIVWVNTRMDYWEPLNKNGEIQTGRVKCSLEVGRELMQEALAILKSTKLGE